MSGPWETRLDNLANGGRDWALPSHAELTENLEALNGALTRAASEPGLVGASGDAATASLDQAAQRAAAIIQTGQELGRQLAAWLDRLERDGGLKACRPAR